jgi:tellurite resistance protein
MRSLDSTRGAMITLRRWSYNRAMTSYERRTWWTRHRMSERLADALFLEAAVAVSYVLALADGEASEDEREALRNRLEILGDVDRDKLHDILTRAAAAPPADTEARIARIKALLPDRAHAEAAFTLALAVALADDEVSPAERAAAAQLMTALDLSGVDLDGVLAELRG